MQFRAILIFFYPIESTAFPPSLRFEYVVWCAWKINIFMLSSLIGIKLIVGSVKAYSAGYDLIKENMLIKCACNESNVTLINHLSKLIANVSVYDRLGNFFYTLRQLRDHKYHFNYRFLASKIMLFNCDVTMHQPSLPHRSNLTMRRKMTTATLTNNLKQGDFSNFSKNIPKNMLAFRK